MYKLKVILCVEVLYDQILSRPQVIAIAYFKIKNCLHIDLFIRHNIKPHINYK